VTSSPATDKILLTGLVTAAAALVACLAHPPVWCSQLKSAPSDLNDGVTSAVDPATASKAVVKKAQRSLAKLVAPSRRRHYFQLSSDLTVLRWAWNKYVLLYYVDGVTADEAALSLTLHISLDPGERLGAVTSRTQSVLLHLDVLGVGCVHNVLVCT